ncbi:MAG TPA: hypothetical protein PK899_10380 [Spirochaetota bacterium]|nr:hypothetical protein [Spirochaetota bacterium]
MRRILSLIPYVSNFHRGAARRLCSPICVNPQNTDGLLKLLKKYLLSVKKMIQQV